MNSLSAVAAPPPATMHAQRREDRTLRAAQEFEAQLILSLLGPLEQSFSQIAERSVKTITSISFFDADETTAHPLACCFQD